MGQRAKGSAVTSAQGCFPRAESPVGSTQKSAALGPNQHSAGGSIAQGPAFSNQHHAITRHGQRNAKSTSTVNVVQYDPCALHESMTLLPPWPAGTSRRTGPL